MTITSKKVRDRARRMTATTSWGIRPRAMFTEVWEWAKCTESMLHSLSRRWKKRRRVERADPDAFIPAREVVYVSEEEGNFNQSGHRP